MKVVDDSRRDFKDRLTALPSLSEWSQYLQRRKVDSSPMRSETSCGLWSMQATMSRELPDRSGGKKLLTQSWHPDQMPHGLPHCPAGWAG